MSNNEAWQLEVMLRETLVASGRLLNHSEVARQAGLSQQAVSKFAKTGTGLSLAAASKLCRVLGLVLVPSGQRPAVLGRVCPPSRCDE